MAAALPIVLVPGLMCSLRLFEPQLGELWRRGPITMADTLRGETIGDIARRILDEAPPRFALAGLSMGGYVALEVMRQAPARVDRLALLSTSARPETPAATEPRLELIALAESGRYEEVPDRLFPLIVHESRRGDETLREAVRAMAREVGAEAFVRQQRAIVARADSRPTLAEIRCPTLVAHGDADGLMPAALAEETAAGIAGARLVRLRECGHMSTLERPRETTRALVEWLDA